MPFTPFHFGPGALVHSAAPQHLSFLAFCGANVLVDVEPLYYIRFCLVAGAIGVGVLVLRWKSQAKA